MTELSNEERKRLAFLMRGCCDVISRIGEINGVGFGPNEKNLLEADLGSLLAAIEIMVNAGDTSYQTLIEHRVVKMLKMYPKGGE